MSEKVFPEWHTKEKLTARINTIFALFIIVPFVLLIATQYWFFTAEGLSDDIVVQGFLYGEGIAAGYTTSLVLAWFVYFVLRIVYFLQGYDLPCGSDLEKADIDIDKDYAQAMWTTKTYSLLGAFSGALSIAYFCVYIVQLLLGSLWYWNPIAILLPIAIATPIILAIHLRKRNRRLKIETKKIMTALSN